MVQPQGWALSHDMGKAGSDSENAGLSIVMENPFNVPVWLNMCGDTDLSGGGCGSSARPVLRRSPDRVTGGSTHLGTPTDVLSFC
ncbi:Uncharacterised protein [Yersinia similis]|nr:Uncharacterised protein [Yersinia similis]